MASLSATVGALVILIGFLALTNIACAESLTRVNLIHPSIEKADFDGSCQDLNKLQNLKKCHVSVSTRGGKYIISSFDWSGDKQGGITRDGQWTKPKPLRDTTMIRDGEKDISIEDFKKKAKAIVGDGRVRLEAQSATGFLYQQANVVHRIDDNSVLVLTIRDSEYRFYVRGNDSKDKCKFDGSCKRGSIFRFFQTDLSKLGYLAPITTVLYDKISNLEFSLLLFDVTGRVLLTNVTITEEVKPGGLKKWKFNAGVKSVYYLSSVPYPGSEQAATSDLPSKLIKILQPDDLESRFDIGFTDAITIDEENSLCYAPAIRKEGSEYLKCNPSKPFNFAIQSKTLNTRILALHMGLSPSGKKYIHMAYQLDDLYDEEKGYEGVSEDTSNNDPGTVLEPILYTVRYLFCPNLEQNIKLDGKVLSIDSELSADESLCIPRKISTAPSDYVVIIGNSTSNQVCNRLVAFFDHQYTIHDPLKQITSETSTVYSADEINFYIKSAYFTNGHLFLATFGSIIVEYDVHYGAKCEDKLNFKIVREHLAQDLLLSSIVGSSHPREPLIYDYREYVLNASDTSPPILLPIDTPTNITTTQAPPPGETSSQSGATTILMIAMVLIGGLIIAGLIYMCLLRNPRGSGPKSIRRSKKSAGRPIDALTVKTVRSAIKGQSDTGAGKTLSPNSKIQSPNSKLRSPGSKMQSPGSKMKSPGSKAQSPGSKAQSPMNSRIKSSSKKSQTGSSSPNANAVKSPVNARRSPSPKSPKLGSKISNKSMKV